MTAAVRARALGEGGEVLALVERAFDSAEHSGREEVEIVEQTWSSGATVPGLDLVAVSEDRLVGHALGATADLSGRRVVAVAPLCVAPEHQGQGIGSALMHELLLRAQEQGWPLVALLGDPGYYSRFGFEASWPLGITYPPAGATDPHFQVRRLEAYDPSWRGQVRYCWEDAAAGPLSPSAARLRPTGRPLR